MTPAEKVLSSTRSTPGASVGDLMSSPVYAVSAHDNLARARKLMLSNGVSRLVVFDGDRPAGIVTKKDLGMRLNQAEPQWRRRPLDQVPVHLIMTPDPITVGPEETVQDAAKTMLDRVISGLLVYDDKEGRYGIVTKHDLVRYFTLVGCPLRVGDMMSGPPPTVSRLHTLNSVIDIMAENNVDRVVVRDADNEKSCSGIITLDDLGFVEINPRGYEDVKESRREWHAGKKRLRKVVELPAVAEDVMTVPLVSVERRTMAEDAAKIMEEHNFDMLPVIESDLVGQFNYEDILQWLSEAPE
jgi:CBS domain-containing protein